jgi:hypothetical protein
MPVGHDLAQARISLGLSVDEVAHRTRIRSANIKKIDRDELKTLGADVYVSGWIRAYAETVGLDPVAMVAKYRAENPVVTEESEVDALPAAPVRVIERKAPKDRTNWSMVLAAVFAGLLMIGGLALMGRLIVGGGGEEPVVASQTVTDEPDSSQALDEPSAGLTSDLTAALPGDPVQITIRVDTGRSWVRVTDIVDTEIFEGILSAGDEQSFSDSSTLNVVVGNAGAVAIVHNGVDLGTVGTEGQVVTLSFDPEVNIG